MPGFGMSTSLRKNRSSKKKITIGPSGLMFHHFHGGRHLADGQGSLSAGDLEKVLFTIGLENILDPQTWLERMQSGHLKQSDRCLTFDDGLLSQYDVALPILNKFSLKAFWFIYSAPFEGKQCYFEIFRKFRSQYFANFKQYLEAFLHQANICSTTLTNDENFKPFHKKYKTNYPFYTDEEILYRFIRNNKLTKQRYIQIGKSLLKQHKVKISEICQTIWMSNKHLQSLAKENHEIGLHSYDHPFDIGGLPLKSQQNQYKKNIDHLRKIEIRPRSVAHPCGSFCKETLNIFNKLGIECGFKSDPSKRSGGNKFPHLVIPRQDAAHL